MKRDANYKRMYLTLFSAVEDAIKSLSSKEQGVYEASVDALRSLIGGEQACEDIYINSTSDNLVYLKLQDVKSTASK